MLLGAGVMLHSCGEAEAEPQADPTEVQRFLSNLESAHLDSPVAEDDDQTRDGGERSIRNFVEGAATRAPSNSTINRLETVVVGRLG